MERPAVKQDLGVDEIEPAGFQHGDAPVLHRKETFLAAEHPLRAKFARLTAAEEEKIGVDRRPHRS
jgi:hypothetical protein